MTVRQKFTIQNIALWLTMTATLAVLSGYIYKAGAKNEKFNTQIEIVKAAIQLVSERNSNTEVKIIEDRNRFAEYCEKSRAKEEKFSVKLDDVAMKQSRVMANQENIQKNQDEMKHTLSQINTKLPPQ